MEPRLSRRRLLTRLAPGVAALGLGCAARPSGPSETAPTETVPTETGPTETAPTPLRIATDAGTFDALGAGPVSGRPVLLMHGFPECSLAWSAQVPVLAAAGYRVVAPDLRGYSPGVRPPDVAEYRLDHGVEDTIRMADALGWARFDLVGHDWGAAVGWIAAARYPDRIRSWTAIAVPHLAAFAEAIAHDPEQRAASAYLEGFRRPTPHPEQEILASGPPELPGVPAGRAAEYFRRLSQPGALTAALHWYRANDFTGYTEPVDVPTLLIAGTIDETVAPAGVEATRRWVRGPYRLARLEGVAHTVPEHAPERTNRLLLDQLSSA